MRGRAADHLGDQPVPEAARVAHWPRRRQSAVARAWPGPQAGVRRSTAGAVTPLSRSAPRSRAPRPCADFRSASAALAACHPGIPHTPPPAWVAELPL